LVALPFVVLVTIMAQPRLQYAMARDGILPAIFAEVDEFGNLINGLKISGVLMTVVATLIPFAYLDDLISSGILIAFTITDASVILVRRKSPLNRPSLLKNLLTAYMAASLLSGFLLRSWLSNGETGGGVLVLTILSCITTATLGYLMQNQCESEKPMMQGLFLTPFVPILPLVGIFINLYLIAQLELTGLLMISGYVGISVAAYLHNKRSKTESRRNGHTKEPPERLISLHEAKR